MRVCLILSFISTYHFGLSRQLLEEDTSLMKVLDLDVLFPSVKGSHKHLMSTVYCSRDYCLQLESEILLMVHHLSLIHI